MPVLTPANERQIGIVPLGDAADVDEAVAAAVSAFPAYSQTGNLNGWRFFKA